MIRTRSAVSHETIDCQALPVELGLSRFRGEGGVEEVHLTVRPTEYGSSAAQLEWVLGAYQYALRCCGVAQGTCVFRRFFSSDLANQAEQLAAQPFADPRDPGEPCAVSWVGQPPVPPGKVALWAYHVSDPAGIEKRREGDALRLRRGALTHLWTTGVTCPGGQTAYDQTAGILERYEASLRSLDLRLTDHVIRTWFFVRNIDVEYPGLVTARREIFATRGLTPETHFIASTGIGGAPADVAAGVMLDAYAIAGVYPDQIEFLTAPEYLSSTHLYGVTFERGVSVAYRDRKHVFLSGTASIDAAGQIVHRGDVARQADRTLENMAALLRSAGAALEDVCAFIVYVRDPSDAELAGRVLRERFSAAPMIVVTAPICRPGWLIEIECQAVVPAAAAGFPPF